MKSYSSTLIFLHWFSAVLLIVMLFGSAFIPLMPHMVMGGLIAVLFITRLLIKTTRKQPEDINQSNKLLSLAGRITHWAMYAVVFATLGSGLAIAIEADLFNVVLNGLPFPEGVDQMLSRSLHDIFEHAVKALLLLHVAAAVFHQMVIKDRIFRRMWWKD